MEEIIKRITDSVGPKWPQLYSRLNLDYRGRYRISASNENMSPERVKYYQCALETIRKWQKEPSLQDKDEKECIEILLNCLMKVKGMEELAEELANQHGIQLIVNPSGTTSGGASLNTSFETSSSEVETTDVRGATAASTVPVISRETQQITPEDIIESYKQLWTLQINMEQKSHKFALLDVCQRMQENHFKQFCTVLGLDKESIERITRQEDLPEEQYYHALKKLVLTSSLTFNDLKNGLLSCSRIDLIGLIINRIVTTSN